jgi:hypothetical protein
MFVNLLIHLQVAFPYRWISDKSHDILGEHYEAEMFYDLYTHGVKQLCTRFHQCKEKIHFHPSRRMMSILFIHVSEPYLMEEYQTHRNINEPTRSAEVWRYFFKVIDLHMQYPSRYIFASHDPYVINMMRENICQLFLSRPLRSQHLGHIPTNALPYFVMHVPMFLRGSVRKCISNMVQSCMYLQVEGNLKYALSDSVLVYKVCYRSHCWNVTGFPRGYGAFMYIFLHGSTLGNILGIYQLLNGILESVESCLLSLEIGVTQFYRNPTGKSVENQGQIGKLPNHAGSWESNWS